MSASDAVAPGAMTTLVVCGLRREAALAGGPGIVSVCGGGDPAALADRLAALDPYPFAAVVSFGLAGALKPGLAVGDVLVPGSLAASPHPISAEWAGVLAEALQRQGIRAASREPIVGSDIPIATAAAKAALHARTGAAAVDMESHVAAAYAERHALPFGILRVISDASDRDVPPAAIAAMGPGGRLDIAGVLGSLLREPRQVPALLRLAREGGLAFRILREAGAALRQPS